METNEVYELDFVPNEIDDIRYCVLDYSDKNDPDYIFCPLVFLEIFTSPCAVLQIGNNILKMPIDWSVVICDKEIGDPEIIPITQLNDRGFNVFTMNPITGFMPNFTQIDIVNIYNEVKWHFPKISTGHILAVPLSDQPNPPCAYFVKETNKIPDTLNLSLMV